MRRSLCLLLLIVGGSATPRSAAGQRSLCFPDIPGITNCIEGRFLDYWQQNGGLPVFGYPISVARDAVNPDTSQTYLTQWFERNRFELHPQHAPPYDVLLGRLGDDRLRQLGRDWQRFGKGRQAAGCLWFHETGHGVCEPFKRYWERHGLQHAALTKDAQSLALFGLPISEPALETNASGDTVMTQWFERARFEWHTAKPNDVRVLLGLLGTELQGAARLPGPPPPPVTEGGPGAASELAADAACSEVDLRKAIADLRWRPAVQPGTEQQVEVTIYRDGFQRGAVERGPTLPPQQSTLRWERLSPGIIHYWRVLTRQPRGWTASVPASFEAPTCVADYQPTPVP
jgi:hypothetical protein